MKPYLLILLFFIALNSYGNELKTALKIEEISPNVFLHQSFKYVENFGLVGSNGLIVVENNNAFIVDTPWTNQNTEKLVSWIKTQGYNPVGSISTHSHEDRAGGIQWLNTHDIPTYASLQTNAILEKKGKTLATHTFEGSEFKTENGLIETFYPGAGHTIDNIVVWLPKSQLLFGGCFVKSLHAKTLGYTGEAFIKQWPRSINNVLSQYPQAKIVVPGHGHYGDLHLLTHTKALVEKNIVDSAK